MNVSSVEVPDQCVIIVHMGSADVAAIPGGSIRRFSTGRQNQECRRSHSAVARLPSLSG
jgi:hypothetical protein